MSAVAAHTGRPARHTAAKRIRSAERSRRAEDGTVTEMARLLLREAGERSALEARRSAARLAGVETVQVAAQAAEAA
jgi:hypothetical protein